MNTQDRINAFYKFEARTAFVKRLADELQIPEGALGSLLFEAVDAETKDAFFKRLEKYDAEVAKQA